MKRNNISYLLLTLLLLLPLAGCNSDRGLIPEQKNGASGRTLTVQLTPAEELKSIVKDLNSRKVFLKWEEGMFDINVAIKQGDVLELIRSVEVTEVKGSSCKFDITLPESIDINKKFDVYGVVSDDVTIADGLLLVRVGGRVMYELTKKSSNSDGYVPLYFVQKDVEMFGEPVKATFTHLGSLAVITVINKDTKPLSTAGFAVRPADGTSEFYYKAALPFVGNEELPYINLLNRNGVMVNRVTRVKYPSVVIPANDVQSVGFWFMPLPNTPTPEVKLAMYDAKARKEVLSSNTRPARTSAMQVGRAYHLYAEWNGTELKLLDNEPEKPLPANQPTMTFTTNLKKGETLWMSIGGTSAENERDIWVDFNNNGRRDKGEYIQEFANTTTSKDLRPYTIDSQTFTIYGEVSTLVMNNGKPTAIDVTKNPHLAVFFNFDGNVEEVDLTHQHKLKRVALENNNIKKITFSPQASTLEEIYVDGNKLSTLDVSMAKNALLIATGNNELTSITTPAKFADLWGFNVENNKLEKEALNSIYNSLNTAGKQLYFEWQYSMNLWGNPGVAASDLSILRKKGWRPVTDEGANASASAGATTETAQRLRAPLKK